MPIEITISKGYSPVEPSTWKDYFAFSLTVAATCYFILISILMWTKRIRKYYPIRVRNIKKMTLMNIFSMFHIWSTMISSDYFNTSREIEQSSCVFWNHWFPFGISLGFWFVIFILRLYDYLALFRFDSNEKRRKWRIFLFLVLFIVPIGLSSAISISECSYLATTSNGVKYCDSSLACQVAEMLYVLIYIIIISVIILIIKFTIHFESVLNEYAVLKDIASQGLVVLLLNGFLQIFDGMVSSWGRFIFATAIIYIHVYASLKLCSKELWYAIKNDEEFAVEFLRNEQKAAQSLLPPSIIKSVKEIRLDFIHWFGMPTGNQSAFSRELKFLDELGIKWDPLFLVVKETADLKKRRREICVEIMNKFLLKGGTYYLCEGERNQNVKDYVAEMINCLDNTVTSISEDMFQKIEDSLVSQFIESGGREYLKIFSKRTFYTAKIDYQLLQAQQSYLREQMKAEKLLTRQHASSYSDGSFDLTDFL